VNKLMPEPKIIYTNNRTSSTNFVRASRQDDGSVIVAFNDDVHGYRTFSLGEKDFEEFKKTLSDI